MGLLAGEFINFFNINNHKKTDFIFYKIVDSIFEKGEEYYKIQCINTKAVVQDKITDIVFDSHLLHSFHPIQACFVGIEYAKYIKSNNTSHSIKHYEKTALTQYLVCRYGNYDLRFQDRKGNISFIHIKSREQFLMDPRDIALSKELIEEFDAAQAFYIGLLAGIKLNNLTNAGDSTTKKIVKPIHLRIVK